MWIWLVAGLILVYLLIFADQTKTDTSEKTERKKQSAARAHDYVELFDDDELIEEFLIIDLLDEEEEDEE